MAETASEIQIQAGDAGAKNLSEHFTELNLSLEEMTTLKKVITEKYQNQTDKVIKITAKNLTAFKAELKAAKEDGDNIPEGNQDDTKADDLPEELSTEEIKQAVDKHLAPQTVTEAAAEAQQQAAEAAAATSKLAVVAGTKGVEVAKKGLDGMLSKLGTALGKIGEMIAGLLASLRGFESAADESTLSNFTSKLSPEAQKTIKTLTHNSFFSFLGNKEEITPIISALKENAELKKAKKEDLTGLSEQIASATSGSEIAEKIANFRPTPPDSETSSATPDKNSIDAKKGEFTASLAENKKIGKYKEVKIGEKNYPCIHIQESNADKTTTKEHIYALTTDGQHTEITFDEKTGEPKLADRPTELKDLPVPVLEKYIGSLLSTQDIKTYLNMTLQDNTTYGTKTLGELLTHEATDDNGKKGIGYEAFGIRYGSSSEGEGSDHWKMRLFLSQKIYTPFIFLKNASNTQNPPILNMQLSGIQKHYESGDTLSE